MTGIQAGISTVSVNEDGGRHLRGKRGEWSAGEAHENAMSLPIEDVVRDLVGLLGLTTVAMIGGVGETRAVTQWTSGRAPAAKHTALHVADRIDDSQF